MDPAVGLASLWSLSVSWTFAHLSALIWTKAESDVDYLLWIKVCSDFWLTLVWLTSSLCLKISSLFGSLYIPAVLSQNLQKKRDLCYKTASGLKCCWRGNSDKCLSEGQNMKQSLSVCVCVCVWANPSLTCHSRLPPSCASSFEVCSWQS